MEKVLFQDLDLISYQDGYEYQQKCREKLIAWQENPSLFEHHFLLFCEHPPTYTLGKRGKEENRLLSLQELDQKEIAYHVSDRGGDITYHGLGQIVAYFIADLSKFKKDLHWYLRSLEEVIILTLAEYQIQSYRIEGLTGVWVKENASHLNPREKKIAAIGIHCKKWVTLHGLALNFDIDLSPFSFIVPCNIPDKGVANLINMKQNITRIQVMDSLKQNFYTVFNLNWI